MAEKNPLHLYAVVRVAGWLAASMKIPIVSRPNAQPKMLQDICLRMNIYGYSVIHLLIAVRITLQ